MRFVEDDRWLVPFVAVSANYTKSVKVMTNAWFIIVNLKTFKVIRTINLNLTHSEQNEIEKPLYRGY